VTDGHRASGIGPREIEAAVSAVRAGMGSRSPKVAVVLGSGLGFLAEEVKDAARIPYAKIPGFPQPGVQGHAGELVIGTLDGVQVLMQSGRFHLYEGHEPSVAALPVRVFATLGVTHLVLTNAAGGIRRSFRPGTLMLISDHLNMSGKNPLVGHALEGETRFPDMSDPYDSELRSMARGVAAREGIVLEEGIYAMMLGPSYETKADIQMLARLGCDAVGMSTATEVIVARARGMKCVGISTITNAAAGIAGPLSHQEVIETAERVKGDLAKLVRGIVRSL